MSVFDSVEERLWFFMGMAQNGSGVWSWCFSEEGTLYYSSCPREKELLTIFQISGCMEYALRKREAEEAPFVMSDTTGLVWLGEYFHIPARERRFMIVGPFFSGDAQMEKVRDSLRKYDISVQMKRQMMRILEEIPVIDMRTMTTYGKMMHYAVTLGNCEHIKIAFQVEREDQPDHHGREESPENKQYTKECAKIRTEREENDEGMEETLLQCVREGNHNYLPAFGGTLRNSHPEEEGYGLKTDRDMKNQVIIFTALCARAAVEGGCPSKKAREMERYFVEQVEKQETLTELMELNRRMLESFIDIVGKYKEYPDVSELVRESFLYVREHVTEDLSLKKIAGELGYSEYYLSRKFYEETGVRLLEHIRSSRLEYAKIWLTTTNKPISAICEELHFGTRSYFERIFRKQIGMTPAEYRKRTRM